MADLGVGNAVLVASLVHSREEVPGLVDRDIPVVRVEAPVDDKDLVGTVAAVVVGHKDPAVAVVVVVGHKDPAAVVGKGPVAAAVAGTAEVVGIDYRDLAAAGLALADYPTIGLHTDVLVPVDHQGDKGPLGVQRDRLAYAYWMRRDIELQRDI